MESPEDKQRLIKEIEDAVKEQVKEIEFLYNRIIAASSVLLSHCELWEGMFKREAERNEKQDTRTED